MAAGELAKPAGDPGTLTTVPERAAITYRASDFARGSHVVDVEPTATRAVTGEQVAKNHGGARLQRKTREPCP
uniref:Uncharacterized protein n=1 Tax=Setaria italica TaxID=4555 RepID=K3YBE1_SETIT